MLEEVARVRERLAGVQDAPRLLEEVFAHTPVALAVCAVDGRCIVANEAFHELFGVEAGYDFNVLEDPRMKGRPAHPLVVAAFDGNDVHFPIQWFEGDDAPVGHVRGRRAMEVSFFPLIDGHGQRTHIAWLFNDVTARELLRQREAELRANEQRFRSIVERTREGIWILDTSGVSTFVNDAMCRMLRCGTERILGRSAFTFVEPARENTARQWLEMRNTGASDVHELCLQRCDGTPLWTRMSTTPLLDDGGRVTGTLAIVSDVTEQREVAEALRLSEERYRIEFEHAPEAILTYDVDAGGFIEANEQAQRLLLRDRDGLKHMTPFDISPPLQPDGRPSREAGAEYIRRVLSGEKVTFDWVHLNARGEEVPCEIRMLLLPGPRRLIHGSVVDLTERRKLHAQLLVSDRMAALGNLAAGVAHEINNPLAASAANLELARRKLTDLGPSATSISVVAQELDEAVEATERVRNIVRDLNTFSQPEGDRRAPVDVCRVIDSSLRMAWSEIRLRARVVRAFGEVPKVDGSEALLGQVFLNLVLNAAQAMPDGGVDTHSLRVTTRTDARGYAVVELKDTGCGIAPEHMDRIFLPFFTTKPIGVGSGLGLTICHRVVTALHGEIRVDSAPHEGTTVTVCFPPSVAETEPARSAEKVPVSRRGVVLVIDDDVAVGNALQRILEESHEVTFMTSAEEAAKSIASGARYDVILCDLMMPVMTGMDLYADLSQKAPDQASRMVFVTGGAFTVRARSFLDAVPNERLDKPFDLDQLLAVVASKVS